MTKGFLPSAGTLLLFALYALLVIPLMKYAFVRFDVPGLSKLAASI